MACHVAKFREIIPSNSKATGTHTLHFKPIFDRLL